MWSLPAFVLLITLFVWLSSGRYVTTDNAYVKGDRALIATELSGIIVEVPVQENQRVSRGQLLFKLDDQSYRLALLRIEAEIETTRAEIRGLRAQWRTKREEIKAALSQQTYAQADFDRQSELAEKKVVSTQKLEEARLATRGRPPAHLRRRGGPDAHRGRACRRSQDPHRRPSQGQADAGRARGGAAAAPPHHRRGADRRHRRQAAGAGQLRHRRHAGDRRRRRHRSVDRGQLQGDRADARARRARRRSSTSTPIPTPNAPARSPASPRRPARSSRCCRRRTPAATG